MLLGENRTVNEDALLAGILRRFLAEAGGYGYISLDDYGGETNDSLCIDATVDLTPEEVAVVRGLLGKP